MADRLYFRQLLAGRDFAVGDPVATQMVNFAYLIGDRDTREAVVVDPAYAVQDLLGVLEADGMRLTGVLATHHHPDHVGGQMLGFDLPGIADLLALQPVPIHVNGAESEWVRRVTGVSGTDLRAHDHDDVLEVGSIPIRLLHTPVTRPAASASSSRTSWSPATRSSWKAVAARTSPAGTPRRSTAACRPSPACPVIPSSTPGTSTRPSRRPRCRRSSAPTSSTGRGRSTSGRSCSAAEQAVPRAETPRFHGLGTD